MASEDRYARPVDGLDWSIAGSFDTTFRWDPSAQQWIFNLSTKNLPSNATFTYIINLNDGSMITFSFGLK